MNVPVQVRRRTLPVCEQCAGARVFGLREGARRLRHRARSVRFLPGGDAVSGHIEMVNDGEPLIVMTDASGRTCESAVCEAGARWYVERCPLPDESYLPPVRYVCSRHVVAAFNELLEARRVRRRAT